MTSYIVIAALWGFSNFMGFDFGPTNNSGPATPTEWNYYIPSGSDHYAVAGGDLYQVATY